MSRPERSNLMEPHTQDAAIRREVLATLKANPAASYDTVRTNWAYHRSEGVDAVEDARVKVIFDQECAAVADGSSANFARPWWRFWGNN